MKICSVEGCTREYYSKEFCQMHYDLQRRRGTTKRLRPEYDLGKNDIADKIKDTRPGHRGYLGVNIVNDIKFKARQRGKDWQLTGGQAFKLITQACYYCGFLPEWPTNRVGIDRVKNDSGYELNNCVPCCFTCNSAKGTMTTEEFMGWIRKVYNHSITLKEK